MKGRAKATLVSTWRGIDFLDRRVLLRITRTADVRILIIVRAVVLVPVVQLAEGTACRARVLSMACAAHVLHSPALPAVRFARRTFLWGNAMGSGRSGRSVVPHNFTNVPAVRFAAAMRIRADNHQTGDRHQQAHSYES